MPPAPGATTLSVLFLEKDALKEQLKQPLEQDAAARDAAAARRRGPRRGGDDRQADAEERLLVRVPAVETGGAAIILDPVG